LKRVRCSDPGITRRRHGRGFSYVEPNGRLVRDGETLARISALAIPPAWKDVWICGRADGHLQAVGTDAAGRRQYLYHEAWRARRDTQKFERIEGFAEALPQLRKVVARDLALDGMPRSKVLGCAVRLLDEASFRIGTEAHAERNGSFGLATLLKKHATPQDGAVVFDYMSKSGKRRVQIVRDPDAVAVLTELKRRRGGGRELLAYRDDGGRWQDVHSRDINEYLKMCADGDYSAKDFRTWQATVLATVLVAAAVAAATPVTSGRRLASSVVKEVAGYLGNTPAVCRASYVDPRVFERFEEGVTVAERLDDPNVEDLEDPRFRTRVEAAVLALLRGEIRLKDMAA